LSHSATSLLQLTLLLLLLLLRLQRLLLLLLLLISSLGDASSTVCQALRMVLVRSGSVSLVGPSRTGSSRWAAAAVKLQVPAASIQTPVTGV
jgi:hypothetical protein